jgi:thioredoxin reductase (NADPH)
MSQYLIDELDRYGVEVRDRSEVLSLHGDEGNLQAITLNDGEKMTLSYLLLFLGAAPCTELAGRRCRAGLRRFILTGTDGGAGRLLQTSLPGVFAAGDVRAGSTKRCATAVGEGANVVRLVHEYLSAATPVGS